MNFCKSTLTQLAKTIDERNRADFENLTLPRMDIARKKDLCQSDLPERHAEYSQATINQNCDPWRKRKFEAATPNLQVGQSENQKQSELKRRTNQDHR
jgi:hypothetical protein